MVRVPLLVMVCCLAVLAVSYTPLGVRAGQIAAKEQAVSRVPLRQVGGSKAAAYKRAAAHATPGQIRAGKVCPLTSNAGTRQLLYGGGFQRVRRARQRGQGMGVWRRHGNPPFSIRARRLSRQQAQVLALEAQYIAQRRA